ncbi:hypothetical protein P7K49_012002 [Saguinus oedipus]|uniref:Uncharacterized protein n=1 Tax=Saguinus oedipus TaxID=9490 RepID=A0ABQ9VSW7_SAGOE|nr:hypothetical protein P7K49_012002 [Saguinus oedipus]
MWVHFHYSAGIQTQPYVAPGPAKTEHCVDPKGKDAASSPSPIQKGGSACGTRRASLAESCADEENLEVSGPLRVTGVTVPPAASPQAPTAAPATTSALPTQRPQTADHPTHPAHVQGRPAAPARLTSAHARPGHPRKRWGRARARAEAGHVTGGRPSLGGEGHVMQHPAQAPEARMRVRAAPPSGGLDRASRGASSRSEGVRGARLAPRPASCGERPALVLPAAGSSGVRGFRWRSPRPVPGPRGVRDGRGPRWPGPVPAARGAL